MNIQEILYNVHLKSYYIAETKKKEIPELCQIQTSPDNNDILIMYLRSAKERLLAYMRKRLISVQWDEEALHITSDRDNAQEMGQSLDNAITDYLTEEVLYRWLCDTYPKLADKTAVEEKLDYVKTCIHSLAPLVSRRATTMGI